MAIENLIKGESDWHLKVNNNFSQFENGLASIPNLTNEVAETLCKIGVLSNLTTTDKTSVVNSIIEVNEQLSEKANQNALDNTTSVLKSIQIPNTHSGTVFGWIDDDCTTGFSTNLKSLCDTYGFKVGLACITGNVGDSTHMTLQQLLDLQSEGYEVYSHSVTHSSALWYSNNLINADSSTLISELKNSQQWLKDNGFTCWDTFVYPGGAYGYDEKAKARSLIKQFYRYAFNSTENFQSFPIDNMMIPRLQPVLGQTFAIDIQPIIDSAIANNTAIIMLTHSGGSTWDANLIGQIIQYLNTNNIPIMTGRQALELKGNAIAIGDWTNNATSNKLFVSKDGQITLPVKFIDGTSPTNGFSFSTSLTSFPKYCESRLLCASSVDTLTSEGGILSIFYSWVGSWYNKQEFVSNTTFRKFARSWNETTSVWNAWIEMTSTQIAVKTVDTVAITLAGTSYKADAITIVPYSDSYATANNLPSGGSGICMTYRFASATSVWQEYRPNYGGNADRRYMRHYYNSAWSPWIPLTTISGATGNRPTDNAIGTQCFDTTLGKPIWVKTAGVKEVDTLTVTGVPTANGNITITLNGTAKTVALTTAMNTPTLVASTISSTAFSGWTVTSSGAVVTFTKIATGLVSTPTFADTGTTGSTGTFVVTTAGVTTAWVDATGATA